MGKSGSVFCGGHCSFLLGPGVYKVLSMPFKILFPQSCVSSGSSINNFRYAEGTTLMAENEEELKSLLMKEKEESENAGLKFNIQKAKIMSSSPITSWKIDGVTVETLTDFIFGASKSLQMVTAAMKLKDTCSLEGKL